MPIIPQRNSTYQCVFYKQHFLYDTHFGRCAWNFSIKDVTVSLCFVRAVLRSLPFFGCLVPMFIVPNFSFILLHVQAAFLTFAMGGSDRYDGNSNMTTAHARLVSGLDSSCRA